MGLIERQTNGSAATGVGVSSTSRSLAAAEVERVYEAYREMLFQFLRRVLRDDQQASDALHATFVKLIELGGDVAPDKLKSWLFRVGFNSALNVRRRIKIEQRSMESIGVWRQLSGRAGAPSTLSPEQSELAERALDALSKLPLEQQTVIKLRIQQNLKFREIAEQLHIPLGTVLTRMRTGLAAIRSALTHRL